MHTGDTKLFVIAHFIHTSAAVLFAAEWEFLWNWAGLGEVDQISSRGTR